MIDALASEFPPLSIPQERALLASTIGAEALRDVLWKHNLRFATMLANEAWQRRTALHICTLEDLLSVSYVSLWDSTGSFDPARNVRFISYAKWSIVRDLNLFLRRCSSGFSIPPLATRILGALSELEKTGKQDSRYSLQQLESARGYRSAVTSIDAAVTESSGEATKHSLIAGPIDTHHEVEAPELSARLGELIDKLVCKDKRLPAMMRAFYGIGEERKTLEEVGDEYHLTRERIRQILFRGLKQLRVLAKLRGFTFKDLLTT